MEATAPGRPDRDRPAAHPDGRVRQSGVGDWIVRIVILVVVGVAVWYGFTRLPYPAAETAGRPYLYEHKGYEGVPDNRLDSGKVQALEERARTQNY
jgi:hypothetical protein